MKTAKGIVVLIFVLVGLTGQAQNVEAFARLDSSSIMIGDQIGLELGIEVPEAFVVEWPVYTDTISQNIEILSQKQIDTALLDNGLRLTKQFTVTSFDSGYFQLPSFEFHFRHESDTVKFIANSNTLYLMVHTPVVDTSQAFKAIKGPVSEPYTFWEVFPWVALGIGVIGLVVFAIWFIRRRQKNKPVFVRRPKPALPPGVLAIQKLEELRHAKVWQQGKLKEYYTELTDIAREYFEGRYRFEAMEMTSDEIMESLKNLNKNKEANEKMKNVLQLADLVKFAKSHPTPLENDISLNHVVDFVNETKLIPAPGPENEETEENQTKKEA